MAERLGKALQKLLQRFESASDLLSFHKTPDSQYFQGFIFLWVRCEVRYF